MRIYLGRCLIEWIDISSINHVIKVEDRTIIKCNDDETQCVSPSTIQPLINKAVAPIPQGRSFVRFDFGFSFL